MFGFFVWFRVAVVVATVWMLVSARASHPSHLLTFLAGMALLSLLSDEKLKRWFVLPEPPRAVKVPDHDGASPGLECLIGSPDEFKEHRADLYDEERIVGSAVLHYGTGQIWAVEAPGRHHHVLWAMDMLKVPHAYHRDQGFLTNWGRYVDRKEAALIAAAANQLLDKQFTPPELFSEDVWVTPPWENKYDGSSSTEGLHQPAVGQHDAAWGLEELHQRGASEGLGVV
jgi:hypothetical protein